jgi:hypothetical protein
MVGLREFFQNVPGEMFLDFAVARHGLGDFCGGILIPIMFSAVTNEDATKFFNLFDKIAVFHASSSSA